jgi:hypothetical protein
MALFDLIEAENRRARNIAKAVEADDTPQLEVLKAKQPPLMTINALLKSANLKIQISLDDERGVVAEGVGGVRYPLAQLSDGERNAVFIAAKVLTAKDDTLLLIDEPERHLHRSIISPLLTSLFAEKKTCAFVISTHEAMLPVDCPDAKTLLLRGCTAAPDGKVSNWDADEVAPGANLDESLLREIIGARRKVIFVEGVESKSLDKPLYNIVFPGVSVIPKGSCRDVENAVSGIRGAGNVHWVSAFGIIDSDSRPDGEIVALKANGIYAVSVYSVESIYYHPDIQELAAKAHAKSIGGNVPGRLAKAKYDALAAVGIHKTRLSQRIAEKTLRALAMRQLPGQPEVQAMSPISISLNVPGEVAKEEEKFESLLAAGDIAAIFSRYPVRETPALELIATALGFQDKQQYASAVRTLLSTDANAMNVVKGFFGSLYTDLGI